MSSTLLEKKGKPSKRRRKGSQSSKPFKSSGFNINISMLSPNLSMLSPHISVDEFTLGLDKVQVERLVKGYSETSAQNINYLNGRLDRNQCCNSGCAKLSIDEGNKFWFQADNDFLVPCHSSVVRVRVVVMIPVYLT